MSALVLEMFFYNINFEVRYKEFIKSVTNTCYVFLQESDRQTMNQFKIKIERMIVIRLLFSIFIRHFS